MKRKFKSTLAIVLSVAVMFTFIPMMGATVSAKTKTKSITLNVPGNYLAIGDSVKLSVKSVKPAKASKAVTWKSSNKKVVTVSSKGVVKAKKKGTATITAVSKSNKKAKKSVKFTVTSMKKVQDNLYEVTYDFDYNLDKFLSDETQDQIVDKLDKGESILGILVDSLGLDVDLTAASEEAVEKAAEKTGPARNGSCSSFAFDNNEGHSVLARNYDWDLGGTGLVIHAKPKNGYESVGVVDLVYSGQNADTLKTKRGQELAKIGIYNTGDGINEKGLTSGQMIVEEGATNQADATKDTLVSCFFTRMILDNCATVDEVEKLLNTKSMRAYYLDPSTYRDASGEELHWLVTDATGDAAVVEYVNNKLHVTRKDSVPEVGDTFNAKGFNEYSYNYLYFGDQASTYSGGAWKDEELAYPVEGGTTDVKSRSAEKFNILTNFLISGVDKKDAKEGQTVNAKTGFVESTEQYIGEGVWRYNLIYDALKANPNMTNEEAMDILEKAKYSGDQDVAASFAYLAEAFKDTDKFNMYMYVEFGKATDEVRAGNVAYYESLTPADSGWQTLWSEIYDTTDKTLTMSVFENYDKQYTFGLDMK